MTELNATINGQNLAININTTHPPFEPETLNAHSFLEYLVESASSVKIFGQFFPC